MRRLNHRAEFKLGLVLCSAAVPAVLLVGGCVGASPPDVESFRGLTKTEVIDYLAEATCQSASACESIDVSCRNGGDDGTEETPRECSGTLQPPIDETDCVEAQQAEWSHALSCLELTTEQQDLAYECYAAYGGLDCPTQADLAAAVAAVENGQEIKSLPAACESLNASVTSCD